MTDKYIDRALTVIPIVALVALCFVVLAVIEIGAMP